VAGSWTIMARKRRNLTLASRRTHLAVRRSSER
jgi:hypothetical protein